MTPTHFPEANAVYGPPADLDESQCMKIPAWDGQVKTGTCDGAKQVVVAWRPTDQEIEAMKNGQAIYVSFLGGPPPHFLTTSFDSAMNIA